MFNRKLTLPTESRIHGDMYVRFGGRYGETYRRKTTRRPIPSLLPDIAPTKTETPEEIYAKAQEAYAANDYVKAFNLYKKAAEQGYAEAQNQLGVMYSSGQGVTQVVGKA